MQIYQLKLLEKKFLTYSGTQSDIFQGYRLFHPMSFTLMNLIEVNCSGEKGFNEIEDL